MMKKKIWIVSGIILATLISLPFLAYPLSYQAQPEALTVMEEAHVTMDYYHFEPSSEMKGHILFYPGGLVDPRSYAPLAYQLALEGYDVYVTKPWFHLQIIAPQQGKSILDQKEDTLPWYIGGHSLGGTSAAFWVHEQPTLFSGLFFLASYPSNSHDFSLIDLPVISISGSLDTVMNRGTYEEAKNLLNPSTTTYVTLDGGNHSQFGDYGFQRGDTEATLTREAQQSAIVESLTTWMES